MAYINFTDINNSVLIDNLERIFLVKDATKMIRRKLSSEELLNLANEDSAKYSFYLYALYNDETIKEDLSDYVVEGGSLSINYNSGVRRNLSISIFNAKHWSPDPVNGFLWKGSKFKLEIGIKTTLVEYVYPAGVFVLKDLEMPHKYSKNQINLEMVDKFGALDGTVGGGIADDIYIPRGSNIVEVVRSLLKSEKMFRDFYDYKTPLFPSQIYGAKTPYTITESSGSSVGSLIIKLMSIINLDVFYDENGRMCTEEMRENIMIDYKPSLWTFSGTDRIYDSHSMKIDFQKVENVIIVEGANINGDIISARVENTNPKSPTNITMFEPKICKITDENIADIGSAYVRANYELFKRSLLSVAQTFSTTLMPWLDVNKVVTINDSYCNLNNVRFLITSMNIPIVGAVKVSMTISNLEEVAFSG